MRFRFPYLERYNRMAGQFNMSVVNPLSRQDHVCTGWRTRRPMMPPTRNTRIQAPPSAFYGVWQFAGQNGNPGGRGIPIGPTRRRGLASPTGSATRPSFAAASAYSTSPIRPTRTVRPASARPPSTRVPFTVNGFRSLDLLQPDIRVRQQSVARVACRRGRIRW